MLGKSTKLSSTIPTVRAMDQNVLLLVKKRVHDLVNSFEDCCDKLKISRLFDLWSINLDAVKGFWCTCNCVHFDEGLGDGMNVVNIEELQLSHFMTRIVNIICAVFIPATFESVSLSIEFWSGIENMNTFLIIWNIAAVGLGYSLQQDFIL